MIQWIDVKKRLPEANDNWKLYAVLTSIEDMHRTQIAWFCYDDKTFRFEKFPDEPINVTHWIELPHWHNIEGDKE